MSTKRLVVLDEQDYKNLIEQSKRPVVDIPQTPIPHPNPVVREISAEPEPQQESKEAEDSSKEEEREAETKEPEDTSKEEEPEQDKEKKQTEPEPSAEDSDPDHKSALQTLIEELSPAIRQPALRLLKRLSKLEVIGFDSGQLILDGEPLEGYSLKKFLVATCKKGAPNDLPLRLRLFLKRNKVFKFRNPKVVLTPKQPWRSMHG